MRGWLKVTLGIALLLALCWGGAVLAWRSNNHMPSTDDLVIYLLVLPLLLLAAFWLGRKMIAIMAAAPAATLAAPAAPTTPAPAPDAPPLVILGAALRAVHGGSADELAAAVADNQARADLDTELVDELGFPLMTARSSEADDDSMKEDVNDWLAAQGLSAIRFEPEQWRALAMGSAVVTELCEQARYTLEPPKDKPDELPLLQLLPVLPQDWHIDQRRAAGLWLRHTALEAGWTGAQLSLAAELPVDARGASPLAVIARLAHHAAANEGPLAAMVVACGSQIGEESINRLAAKGTLFTAAQPQGLVPGEGAAGLLLVDFAQAGRIADAPVTLHTVDDARRHNSADEAKRADSALLNTLTEKVLLRAKSGAADVAMLLADTDHRSSRVLELMGVSEKSLPQLDAATDVVALGTACGSCGAVPFMTALAMARHYALERAAPILCISNEDPYRRSAVLVQPAASLS